MSTARVQQLESHQSLARLKFVLDLLAKSIGEGGELQVILSVTLLWCTTRQEAAEQSTMDKSTRAKKKDGDDGTTPYPMCPSALGGEGGGGAEEGKNHLTSEQGAEAVIGNV